MILFHDTPNKFIANYQKTLDFNGIKHSFLDSQDPDFWLKVKEARLFMMHLHLDAASLIRQRNLISVIDRVLGVPCFPDWNTAWHYDEKIAMSTLLQAKDYPLAKTWIFWDEDSALKWAETAEYPVIFKLKNGASSINVVKLEGFKQAQKLITQMFGRGIENNRVPGSKLFSIYKRDPKGFLRAQSIHWLDKLGLRYNKYGNPSRERGYVLFQEFLPNNNFDYRVNIYGDATFAFKRLNRPGDFRSSGSGRYDFDPRGIPEDVLQIAQGISQEMKFQMMAYDFLMDKEGKPAIIEIGCQSAGIAVAQCPGYWDMNLNWHEGRVWPQVMILRYLLPEKEILHPKLD